MGGEIWYETENEYMLAEALILMTLVCCAIIFELCHHKLHHLTHAVHYGIGDFYAQKAKHHVECDDEHLVASALVLGANAHYERLFQRMNGEFMVLGFLAFTVWGTNRAGGFKSMGKSLNNRPDAYSLLHLTEDVHMWLFISMFLNFCLAAMLIHKIVRWQLLFATYEFPSLEKMADEKHSKWRNIAAPSLFQKSNGAEGWNHLRNYFIEVQKKQTYADGENPVNDDFDFARYISASLDQVLADQVAFSESTWGIILVIFALHAIMVKAMPEAWVGDMALCEFQLWLLVVMIPALTYYAAKVGERYLKAIIEKSKNKDFDCAKSAFGERFNMEVHISRICQALMYQVCYQCARLVGNTMFWDGAMGRGIGVGWSALWLGSYLVIFVSVGYILLPKCLVVSTLYYALPPNVDETNHKTMIACTKYAAKSRDVEAGQRAQPPGTIFSPKVAKVAPQESADALEDARWEADLEHSPTESKERRRSVNPLPESPAGSGAAFPPILPPNVLPGVEVEPTPPA